MFPKMTSIKMNHKFSYQDPFSHFSQNLKINVPSMAIIPNITGICKRPLQAMISPKSVPVALTIKLMTVSASPDVKAIKWLQDISTPDF